MCRISSISFNPAMLVAVRAGRKTVTRRRISIDSLLQREPDQYRFVGLSAQGALFENIYSQPPVLLPALPLPFGPAGHLLRVAEDPHLQLQVRRVWAEQVRCLTAADALAEGIYQRISANQLQWGGVEPALEPGAYRWCRSPIEAFWGLLDTIYPTAWARNEWVWVIEFARLPDTVAAPSSVDATI